MRRRTNFTAAVFGILAFVVGCGSDGPASGSPAALAGETEQGLRIVLDPSDQEVVVRVSIDCPTGLREIGRPAGRPSAVPVPLEQRPLAGKVGPNGRFTVREHYVVEGGDGDETEVDLRLVGSFHADGTATGTAGVEMEGRNGQDPDHPQTCRVEVPWRADEPLVRPAGPVVELGAEAHVLEATSHEVWALVVPTGPPDGQKGDVVQLGVDGVRSRWRGVVEDPASVAFVDSLVSDETGGFWYPTGQHDHSFTVHIASGGAVTKFAFPEHIQDVIVSDGQLWAAGAIVGQPPHFRLHRLDPTTGVVLATLPQAGSGRLATDGRRLWVTDDVTGDLSVLGAADGNVERRVHLGEVYGFPALTVGASTAWYPIQWDVLGRLDEDGTMTSIPLPSTIADIEADDTGAWVSSSREAVIRRIEGGRVVSVIDVPRGVGQIAIDGDGAVWVATGSQVVRVTSPESSRPGRSPKGRTETDRQEFSSREG